MDRPTSYLGEQVQKFASELDQLEMASLSLGELWMLACSFLVAVLIGLFCLKFLCRFALHRYRFMSPKIRRRAGIGFVVLLLYITLYLGSTTVQAQGYGGLTGPLRVRMFQSEGHLVVFYPLYLVERWVRNGDLYFAGYYFNVDFKNGKYAHFWLYGDGKYGRIWYDF